MADQNLTPEEKAQGSAEKQSERSEEKAPAGPAERAAAPPGSPPPAAEFPKGFWRGVDYLLTHQEEVIESSHRDAELQRLSRVLFTISLLMAALYGAVMGATNLLQGSQISFSAKLALIVITAIKVPVLFLLTLAIVLPPVYVSNAFVGGRLPFYQICTKLLASIAITSAVLASMATVAFFFALTSRSYNFIKLLHVAIFIYAGLAGLSYLVRCLHAVPAYGEEGSGPRLPRFRHTPPLLFLGWLLLYMFVGTQLAWVLRPFVGSPSEKFQLFRPRQGNFYESVYRSLNDLLEK